MEKPKLYSIEEPNTNVWYETNDPNFTELGQQSLILDSWASYIPVANGEYSDSILKPINNYAQHLYPNPDLVSIEGNVVRLRQGTHAEIMLLQKKKEFISVDRPHIRQYYNSAETQDIPSNCFEKVFKFYVPWVIDENVFVRFENVVGESAFFVYDSACNFRKITRDTRYIEPFLVPFSFKKEGPHMRDQRIFGIIPIASPMYDMIFEASDDTIEKIRNFYEK